MIFMNFRLLILIGLTVSVFTNGCTEVKKSPPVNYSFMVEDDLGTKVLFDSIPNSLVTLAPNLTEMIFDLGLEDKLIGNTLYCNYPEASKSIPKIGDMISIDYEKLLVIKPDLILITVEGNTKETFDKLNEIGSKVFVSNPRNFKGVIHTYKNIAKIFNMDSLAERRVNEWEGILKEIQLNNSTRGKRSAMFIVSLHPIMLAGRNTFLNEFLTVCGLENIVADSPQNYPMYNREAILLKNPEVIIHSIESENIADAYIEWENLKAITTGNVFYVDPDLFFRPGPRFAEAATILDGLVRNSN